MSNELLSALSANIHAQNIAQRDYEKAQTEAEKWERQHQRALQSGPEYLIRETQSRKEIHAKKAEDLKTILNQQTQRLNRIRLLINTPSQVQDKIAKSEIVSCHNSNTNLENRLSKLVRELEAMQAKLLTQHLAIGELLQQNTLALETVRTLVVEVSSRRPIELDSTGLETHWPEFEETGNSDLVDASCLALVGIA